MSVPRINSKFTLSFFCSARTRRTRLQQMALRMLGRRSMSAAAAPVTKFGTPGRYANAIYAAAAKKNALAAVTDDLSLLKETLKASATLHHFVTNPSIPRETKASGIVKLLTSAKADGVTKNAMATLAEGGRMHDVLKVIDNYMEIITAAKGEVNAVITSAAPLPEEEKAAIRAQLVSFLVRCRPAPACASDSPPVSNSPLPCGTLISTRHVPLSLPQDKGQTKVESVFKVDASLVSGITVEIGDKFLDASVATQLKKLHSLLKTSI